MNAKTKLLRKMETKESIEQERNLLKITLDHLARDNESLKECLEDMRSTAIANKQLLNEYVETVTGKDLMVEKLRHTILQLQNRIQTLEDYIKMNQIENNRYACLI